MKIALDVDGVLAEFNTAFLELLQGVAFRPHEEPPMDWLDHWDWPTRLGFTEAQVKEAWQLIDEMPQWWSMLPPTQDCLAILDNQLFHKCVNHYEVTVITNRPNRYMTELWLLQTTGFYIPVVSVKGDKGPVYDALQIDIAVDDKPSNLLTSNRCQRLYLIDQPYNRSEDDLRLTRTSLFDLMLGLTKDIPDDPQ